MKIGMIVAMRSEVESAIAEFGSPLGKFRSAGFEITEHKIGESEVLLLQSGVGEIYAAAAAQTLISVCGAEVLVNYGIVGGLTDEMTLCRAVAVDRVVHYDFDLSEIDNVEPGRYPGYSSVYLETDRGLLDKALAAVPGLTKATCASADKFVGTEEKKRKLHSLYNADICDMEAAGIILTADRAGVPVLMIKAVSDSVRAGADEFELMVKEAAGVCVKATLAVLGA